MSHNLKLIQGGAMLLFHGSSGCYDYRIPNRSCYYYIPKKKISKSSVQGSNETVDYTRKHSICSEAIFWDEDRLDAAIHVQTLKKFPKEELFGKVVLIRVDSDLLLQQLLHSNASSVKTSISTIKYLSQSGAKILLVGSWARPKGTTHLLSSESFADHLSSVLQLKVVPANWVSVNTQLKAEERGTADILLFENLSKFKDEFANCSVFAQKLSSGVDIFVNDAFSLSHKMLASTVGVSRHCYASVAGFCFEKELGDMVDAVRTTKQPYFAIIGGGNLLDKMEAIQLLASKCDGLVFVGMMAFQIMNAVGLAVPLSFVEPGVMEYALKIVQLVHERNIKVILPKDFWCINNHLLKQTRIFPANGILDEFSSGWEPVDIGPDSFNEISSCLSNCKKILWIGPAKFRMSDHDTHGAHKLAEIVEAASRKGCAVTVVGSAACKAINQVPTSLSFCSLHENASVVWEFLKGRTLPGVAALDRAYPFEIDWSSVFHDPARPLVVDIGSGNGLFIFGMARKQADVNFLGLEINKKLVKRCLASVLQSGLKNGYFIATNATSAFRSIVASYPGELVLVSIQCPNPDFNQPEHRWRMLQRSLVEAISDLLTSGGKVFLQSDIEEVAMRMKEQFMVYGKGKLAIVKNEADDEINRRGWMEENPFGVRTDWEKHVMDRGCPMYRLMISKVDKTL